MRLTKYGDRVETIDSAFATRLGLARVQSFHDWGLARALVNIVIGRRKRTYLNHEAIPQTPSGLGVLSCGLRLSCRTANCEVPARRRRISAEETETSHLFFERSG